MSQKAVIAAVADQIRSSAATRVGVDGVDGAGKSTFAATLAEFLEERGTPVAHVSVDDFHHRRDVRYRRGSKSPEGFWLDSYDYPTFCRDVLAPFGEGGDRTYRTASHDLESDENVPGMRIAARAGTVLIVDGIFLHRDELVGYWDLSVFLRVPFEETARRMADRDQSHPDAEHPTMRRYVEGQRIYLRTCQPEERASITIDNTNPQEPRIE